MAAQRRLPQRQASLQVPDTPALTTTQKKKDSISEAAVPPEFATVTGESNRRIRATLHSGEPEPKADPSAGQSLEFGPLVSFSLPGSEVVIESLEQQTEGGQACFVGFTIGGLVEEGKKGRYVPEPGLYSLRFESEGLEPAFVLLSLTEPGKQPPPYKPRKK